MFSLKIYWIIKILQIQVNDNSRDVEKDNKKKLVKSIKLMILNVTKLNYRIENN